MNDTMMNDCYGVKVDPVLTVGDTLCFLASNSPAAIEYKVTNAGIAIPETTGSYQVGFWLEELDPIFEGVFTNSKIEFVPDYTILDFLKDGIMWKKGREESAKRLRELRSRQLMERHP